MSQPHVASYLESTSVSSYMAGLIPLGVLPQTTADNIMLVGDAASQVKPTSGGGIYTGLVCANHCISIAQNAIENHTLTDLYLQTYHKNWTKDIGKELSMGMRFRHIFTNLDDDHLDKYLQKLNKPKIIDIINAHGDIDHPSNLVLPLMKQAPSLAKLLFHYKK